MNLKIPLLRAFSPSYTLVWEGVDSYAGQGGLFLYFNSLHLYTKENILYTINIHNVIYDTCRKV